jgi:hypothetical protein
VSPLTKLLGLTVFAAMFYTAVAPDSQTNKIAGTLFGGWNSTLKVLTGQR